MAKNPSASDKKSSNTKAAKKTTPQNSEPAVVSEKSPPEEGGGLPFPTVGVGASAGGLQAFTDLLRALPPTTGLAYVFVQHLHPKHVSMLSQLLARETQMKVQEVTDGTAVEPNHVYVIPRDTLLRMKGGTLHVLPREHGPGSQMPVDVFFESLARDQGSSAMGVVLSGTDGDGAGGLKSIKAGGGIIFVQSPASATFPGMPRTAIATGYADVIGSPAEIAAEIARLAGTPSQQLIAKAAEEHESDADTTLQPLFAQLKATVGVDFQHYKRSTVTRRITRRMLLNKFDSVAKYASFLRHNRTEVDALYEDLLINVTEFFRDPDVFEALKTIVFPKILQDKGSDAAIRIWVPGCSTGEEVYSIAIALMEFLDEHAANAPVHIFATDISESALHQARMGVYAEIAVRDISRDRLRRFFSRQDRGYQVSARIREMCVFARQDLSRDPPFSKLDLISCRNVLIYLDTVLQKRIMPVFQYALQPHGFLLLGASESIGGSSENFTVVDKAHKIYMRTPGAARSGLQFAVRSTAERTIIPEKAQAPWSDRDLHLEADRLILARHTHPAVIIDDDLNILQFRGRTGTFLEGAPGAASLNLLRMTREGLMLELRNLVQKCRNEQQTVRREHIRINVDGTIKEVSLEVIPFKRGEPGNERYLVLFEEPQTTESKQEAERSKKTAGKTAKEADTREIEQLRRDLQTTQEYLQSTIEEHDASIEELRSANEEILSANEELQSTNEELETAKEELQSANEELSTVNDELQDRNVQLSQISNDLLNLLGNVSMAIVMIGIDLRIRRFTPASEKLLNLISTDVGRPITDIKFNIDIPDLPKLLLEVMDTLAPHTVDLVDYNGRPYSLRLRPYRTEDNRIEGVVMVLVDVDTTAPASGAEETQGRARPLLPSASELVLAQEEERRRLARELHDELSQRLALLEVTAEMIEHRREIKDPVVCEQLRLIREQVADISADVRRIAYRLHPTILEDLGLAVALSSYIDEVKSHENLDVNLVLSHVPEKVRPATALSIYRIVQEALRNVSKHARGAHVDLSFGKVADRLRLTIKDDGPGFEQGSQRLRGLGLVSMEERARSVGGVFEVRSALGQGTELIADVPDI